MKTRRILIAEDSDALKTLYDTLLAKHFPQYYFCIVTNGAEARDALKRAQYDLVITDLNMPTLDGDELYRMVLKMSAEESREMPAFIFCSGVKQALDDVRATCSGRLNRFMLKPFRLHELHGAILETIGRHEVGAAQTL
jgi:CheY-like chemotaxis protein